MRWFVEVSRVGDSTLAERYCVEAKAWQAALQETRKLRGDSGPLSKFSIELLDDGYRAVDPVQKIRYLVNQAPGDAPLVMPSQVNGTSHSVATSTAPAAGPSNPPAASVPTVAPVASVSRAPAAAVAPAGGSAVPAASPAVSSAAVSPAPSVAPAPVKKVMGVQLGASIPATSNSAAHSTAAAGAPRPSPRRSGPPKADARGTDETKVAQPSAPAPTPLMPPVAPVTAPAGTSVPAPAVSVAPAVTVTPAVSIAPAVSVGPAVSAAPAVALKAPPAATGAPGVPAFEIFASRVQEPSPEAPIAYREIACVVAPGTQREAIEVLLRDRLKAARADFSARPPGQLIQIAIFDHVFEDRPQRAPLGTLAWKDWRGEPILGYPAFGEAAPPTTASLPPSPIVPIVSDPAGVPAPAPVPTEAAPAVTVPAPAEAPSVPAPAEAKPAPSADADEQPVLLRRPASRPDSDPGSRPRIAIARRRAGEDLISELFESMHELHFARDIAVGAEFVLGVIDQVIPCEATLIQVFDINTRNFVVVRGRGGSARKALLHRTPDNDPLTSEIMRRERTRAYRTEGDARFSSGRWGVVGLPLREVLCGAVRQGGRYLGMIELANPQGGAPFHETEINALDYICEQFADFVASRPVVLDPDVILGR